MDIISSVVDPNTLNLDPDPEFWLILDLDPRLSILKNNVSKTNFKEFF